MKFLTFILPVSASLICATATALAQAKVRIADISSKTMQQIEKAFGKPTKKEVAKPSRTPCPCNKLSYRNGQIEVVFMKGKADWITINLPPSQVDTSGSYKSLKKFDTYVYVKVATD